MTNNLIVGCSHVEGFELEQELGYTGIKHTHRDNLTIAAYRKKTRFAAKLADKLKIPFNVVSHTGADNSWITYSTVRYIEELKVKPKNVIVCLTGITRQQRYYKGKPYFINPLYPGHAAELNKGHNKDAESIVNWELAENRLFLDMNYYLQQTYHYVNYLKYFLESKKVNFFILKSIENDLDLTQFTPNTIGTSFVEFAEAGNYKKGEYGHFLSEAHNAWADYIVEQLGDKFKK